MSAPVDQLLEKAMELPEAERSALVAALIDSLDGIDGASVSDAWREEVLRRRDELRAGRVQATSWAEARARLADL